MGRLQALGIDHRSIGRRGSRLPQASLLALVEHAASRLNDPLFALRLGYERDPRDSGVLTFIGLSGYPFHSPNSGRLADILGVMMEW